MICLTGDLHHASLGTGNQRACDRSELEVAARYLAMLREARVKVTFFVTGRAFREEWGALRAVCEDPLVELGGHGYTCFEPALLHRVSKKVLGSYAGPAFYERLDVQRTLAAAHERTGRTLRLWRNHMYMHGPWTDRVLASCGIVACSDAVQANATGPRWLPEGLFEVPINVLPDHEHLYHAERTPEWVRAWVARYHWSDDFGPASYAIGEWTERVLQGLADNEARGALSTMIVHPITMYLADRFQSFSRILALLASRHTVHMGQVVDDALRRRVRQPLTAGAPS